MGYLGSVDKSLQVILEEARQNYKADIIVEMESNDAEQLDANAAQVWPQHSTTADPTAQDHR